MSQGRQLRRTELKIVATQACRITTGHMKHGNECREFEEQNPDLEEHNQQPEGSRKKENAGRSEHQGVPRLFFVCRGTFLPRFPQYVVEMHACPFLFLCIGSHLEALIESEPLQCLLSYHMQPTSCPLHGHPTTRLVHVHPEVQRSIMARFRPSAP